MSKRARKENESEQPAKKKMKTESDEENNKDLEKLKTFSGLGLITELCEACSSLGYTEPTDIQKMAIPVALGEKDVIGLAETGSGKTAAFALPALQHMCENPNIKHVHTVVLAPTRELAVQIHEQFEALGSTVGVRCVTIIGGVDRTQQAIALAKRPHVIVASPGRLVDHLENTKGFHLKHLKFLIFDEADQLLNMDFEKDITKIIKCIPKERKTMLFSATMTSKVNKLKRAALTDPVKVEVSKKYQTVEGLTQEYALIPAKYKETYATFFLTEFTGKSMIIFVQKRRTAQQLALIFRNLGFAALPLHGQLSQSRRLGALNKFKAGQRNILIATDVASRGLDIPHVDIIFNYDIPNSAKTYIHRVGRTARAGRTGRALTFVTQYDIEMLQRIEHTLATQLPEIKPNKQEVMCYLERTTQANRLATMEIKEMEEKIKEKKANRKNKSSGGKIYDNKR